MDELKNRMGPSYEDPKTLNAVQDQVDIAVDTTVIQHAGAPPQIKLDYMSKKIVLIRSLRDIGRGMQDAISKIEGGLPEGSVYDYIAGELKKVPVLHEIFASNTYEELMAEIEPFKDTGGVKHDYKYMLQPDVAVVCREVLHRIHNPQ